MLAIRCQFLQGTYQAATPGRITEAEWPPHPARLHAALVAAGWSLHRESFPQDVRTALLWLEQQPPPAIAIPPFVATRSAPSVYVPRNPTPREASSVRGHLRAGRMTAARRESGRVDRVFPASVLGDEPVWFVWRRAEPPGEVRVSLDRALAAVQYLGSSRSPVTCALGADPPDPGLVPVEGQGSTALRAPYAGLTDALIASRGADARRHLSATVAYGRPDEPAQSHTRGPFDTLVVLERKVGFGLSVEHAALLARALRAAALAQAGDKAPAILHGHGRNPHVAFLALPNVGHRHSTGEILGLAVAVPADASGEERAAIVAAVGRVRTLTIHEGVMPWELATFRGSPDRRTLDPVRWVGPARRWRTVTPIVLDRHAKGQEPIEDVARLSFANALLPKPVEIRLSSVPFLGGAVATGMHRGHGAPSGAMVHAEVAFAEPLRGPVLVGRGRYMGLGLFAPDPERGLA